MLYHLSITLNRFHVSSLFIPIYRNSYCRRPLHRSIPTSKHRFRDPWINMKILRINRQIATTFVMCSRSGKSNLRSIVTQSIKIVLYLAILISVDWFCACYARERLQLDGIENSTFALTQAIAVLTSIACFVSLVYQKNSVRRFFDQIQKIFDQCNLPHHHRL